MIQDAARAFGISRQAVSKWFANGVPADRADTIADLGAATDLLLKDGKNKPNVLEIGTGYSQITKRWSGN